MSLSRHLRRFRNHARRSSPPARRSTPRHRQSTRRLRVGRLEDRCLLSVVPFTVNTTDDTPDANPGDGLAQDAAGNTSLRAAIEEANATLNTIQEEEFLFVDGFEGDLSQWVGKEEEGGSHHGVIVDDPLQPGNHVLSFTERVAAGDVFGPEVTVTEGYTYVLTFDYLGLPIPGSPAGNLGGTVGFAEDTPGRVRWLAGTTLGSGIEDDPLIDDGQWHTYSIGFHVFDTVDYKGQVFSPGDPPSNNTIRVMLEDYSVPPGDVFFDNIQLTGGWETPDRIEFDIPLGDQNHWYYRDDGVPGSLSLIENTDQPDNQIADFDPDYPGDPHSWFRIQPQSALPRITDRVVIDGYTQPGANPNTQEVGSNAELLIELDGSLAGSSRGLTITAGGCTVQGLVINRFGASGISLSDNGENVVAGNFIGTDVTGTAALGNHRGVWVYSGAKWNRIGTDGDGIGDAAEGNLISGNTENGVYIMDAGADFNVVAGNFIGTDVTGTCALGNLANGIAIQTGAQSNRIGTNGDGIADAAERNIISGNNTEGVRIAHAGTDSNVVAGNYVGTDVTGTCALGNQSYGIAIYAGAESNRIGTNEDGLADEAERNVISANGVDGLHISHSNQNVVTGNYIGTDATGLAALGNVWTGVDIGDHAQSNVIGTDGDGTADEAERNVISGNRVGVGIYGSGTDQNIVAGNYIGTDATGLLAVGNGSLGIEITAGVYGTRIGTNADGVGDAAERNVVSANGFHGIRIQGDGTNGNVVAGNYIGTDSAGKEPLGNANSGVLVGWGAKSNHVGTNGDGIQDDAERNVISGNTEAGVVLRGPGTMSNVVAGNYVGTDVTGVRPLGNAGHGVTIGSGASSNWIGTNGDGVADGAERNVISANRKGVFISGAGSDGNVVAGNYIGTDATGLAALGNAEQGVDTWDHVQSNIIGTDGDGTADEAERNVISGNGAGVALTGSGSEHNVVAGNYIGTDVTGVRPLGNAGIGVTIGWGASSNWIGTNGDGVADDAERNVISGNYQKGVFVRDVGSDGNVIAGNYVGTDATGLLAMGNREEGINLWNVRSNRVGTNGDGIGDDAERNVVADNRWGGVAVSGTPAVLNVIAGNFIGTDATGSVALGNSGYGVAIGNAADNTIGGSTPAARNLISGNQGHGVILQGSGTSRNTVAGNYVGADASGTTALANLLDGVRIRDGAWSNVIGADGDGLFDAAEANTIAFNMGAGVQVLGSTTTGNSIRANSIHLNGSLGIDLDGAGITANDPGDPDTGPNNLQNFPVVTQSIAGATTRIVGTFDSLPDTAFALDFYANAVADPSGFGEGARHLGFITVITNEAGNADFDVTFAVATSVGEVITSTATDPAGNTSEFSNAEVEVPDNVAPTADANGPYMVDEGRSVQLDASGSSDPNQAKSTLTFDWDLDGDNIFGETGASADRGDEVGMNPTFSAAGLDGPSVLTVALRVTDEGGLTGTDTALIYVENVAPTLSIAGPTSGLEGSPVSLTGSATDPAGVNDTISLAWTVTKDGAEFASGTGPDIEFTPDDNASYMVTLTASDEDGGSTTVEQTLVVDNVAPVITAFASSSPGCGGAAEGEAVTVSGSFTDEGTLDTHTAIINWGDGTTSSALITESDGSGSVSGDHVYLDGGVFTIAITRFRQQ